MNKIRISAVKYANTYPFIYGLSESGFEKKAVIKTDHPSECASKLMKNEADVGLIPVGALPFLREYHIVSDFCIGANGYVRTVQLLSNTAFDEIKTIYLDYRSRTSVNLVKVLAADSWKKQFNWVNTSENFNFAAIKKGEGAVLIGDQCFEYENNFVFRSDLAYEWKCYTGLPFVFACWVSTRKLEDAFVNEFNDALRSGVENIDKVVECFGSTGIIRHEELKRYLTENIDFRFDDDKRRALELFHSLMSKLKD